MNQLSSSIVEPWDFGDKRLTLRAVLIEEILSLKYGKPLSSVFKSASDLKRAYEFFANAKTSFTKVTAPYHQETAKQIREWPIVLAVGDTTYLDYKNIRSKREKYGPIGNGGNGLILHSALAVNADNGQPMGLLWSKLWHREHKQSNARKTKKQKKKQLFSSEKTSS